MLNAHAEILAIYPQMERTYYRPVALVSGSQVAL
jgi:hypothetical protein